jgi:hypothetical protein
MDEGMPIPNYLYHANKGYFVAWQVDGYFATQRGIQYLNDIVGRISISLNAFKPLRLPYKPDLKEDLAHYYSKIYKLFEFRSLKSLPPKAHAPARADSFEDYTFWAIKLYCEDLISQFGEGIPVPYHLIWEWASVQFNHHKKGISTVKIKCNSVWRYYDRNDWQLQKKYIKKDAKEVKMTRVERAKTNARAKSDKARKAVFNTITGMFADEYKKKSRAWHIGKISAATGVNEKTVSKYIKEFEEQRAE